MMISAATELVLPRRTGRLALSNRLILVLATIAALAVAAVLTSTARPVPVEPDLAMVLRCMAAIKGGLAVLALAGCVWRLGRPAPAWRMIVYMAAPPLMAAGTLALWRLDSLGLAALGLHLGLFALLAAALTDPNFIRFPRGRGDRG